MVSTNFSIFDQLHNYTTMKPLTLKLWLRSVLQIKVTRSVLNERISSDNQTRSHPIRFDGCWINFMYILYILENIFSQPKMSSAWLSMNRKKTHESIECIASFLHPHLRAVYRLEGSKGQGVQAFYLASFLHHPHLRAVCVSRSQGAKGAAFACNNGIILSVNHRWSKRS